MLFCFQECLPACLIFHRRKWHWNCQDDQRSLVIYISNKKKMQCRFDSAAVSIHPRQIAIFVNLSICGARHFWKRFAASHDEYFLLFGPERGYRPKIVKNMTFLGKKNPQMLSKEFWTQIADAFTRTSKVSITNTEEYSKTIKSTGKKNTTKTRLSTI